MAKKASRLFLNFQPEKFLLQLSIDPDKMIFDGHVVISGKKTGSPSKRLTFHQKDLKITDAKISRIDKSTNDNIEIARINLHKSFEEVRLHTNEILYPGQYRIEITFSGRVSDAMHGIYPCYYDKRRQKLIATQFESHYAREAFPCIDEPEAKAVFELTLETPAGQTVLGNTPIKNQKSKINKQITEFEPSPKMSTYLLAFAFGKLKYKESKTNSGIKVRAYATPANYKLLDFALDTAVRCVDFFENYFQTPYPLAKLDFIGLPDFSSGAMENWGLITFRESLFLVDEKSTSIETKQLAALVIAHEISHQWFGNLVTMRWWDDLWLNESFANLMEYVAVDRLFPKWRIFEQFINGEMAAAFRRDSLPHVQAIRTKVRHPDELSTLFDPAIVYAKGGCILHMVRNLIGDEAFRQGLKIYFKKHKFNNTEASDLWQALSSATKINVDSFMEGWLHQPGFPLVEVDYQPGSMTFKATQQRLVAGRRSSIDSTIWQVPLALSAPDKRLLSDKESTFKLGESLPTLIFNDEAQSYYLPFYRNQAHLQSIIQAVSKKSLSIVNRLQLVTAYNLLEKALIVQNADNLELLLAYQSEVEEPVWNVMSAVLGDAKRLIIGQKSDEQNLNFYIAGLVDSLVKQLGFEGRQPETAQTKRLRSLALSLAASAEVADVLLEGHKRFAAFQKPSDLAADIRDVVYYITARFGSSADFNKLVKIYKALENADEKNEIAGALSSTRNDNQIKTLLSMMTTDDVRRQDTTSWFISLLSNYYARDLTWRWLVDNWDFIEVNFAGDKSYSTFPKYAAAVLSRPNELVNYKRFFEPKLKVLALERAISLGIEEIEARIAWRKYNEATTKKWLARFTEGPTL
ncbi:hypothetical protein A3F65_01775 [Candidatus Saccharibacteria bacterium RIFCSPHIGHO2_12_FULL_47_16b]|nr:MAG: hypothetical protein A3F65_01775 [Candidatus Saccharibacteria bacterium RIFCSPHIGHO2_12_FULL_47_16b]